jgi:hypothetical protein
MWNPPADAIGKCRPHVYARRCDPAPLHCTQLLGEETIERLFFPPTAKPQRLSRFQIAHHRDEALFASQIQFIHAHLTQNRRLPSLRPPLQISLIDRPHRARVQSEPSRHLAHRRRFASQPDFVFKVFAERRLARQLRRHFHLDATLRATHPIELNENRRLVLPPRQIANFALPYLDNLRAAPATSRAGQYTIPAFPPHCTEPNYLCGVAAWREINSESTSDRVCPAVSARSPRRG